MQQSAEAFHTATTWVGEGLPYGEGGQAQSIFLYKPRCWNRGALIAGIC